MREVVTEAGAEEVQVQVATFHVVALGADCDMERIIEPCVLCVHT